MAAIDVGAAAIPRPTLFNADITMLSADNPANASGEITSVEIFADTSLTGMRVGTFYLISGTTYKCRDSVVIGDVPSGSKRTFSGLSLAIETGDLIGCYFASGAIEADTSGYGGAYYEFGEYIDIDDQVSFFLVDGYALSLYGIGAEVAPPAEGGAQSIVMGAEIKTGGAQNIMMGFP